ncbi:MAG: hypothetical protein AB8G95_14605 [Anaerolineae bacterium]
MIRHSILFFLFSTILLVGCQPAPSQVIEIPATPSVPSTEVDPTAIPETDPVGENESVPADDESMPQADKHPHVTLAKEDLANQINVAIEDIEAVSVRSMTWPDSSLGCPEPDMMYTQAQVEGMLIQLQVNDATYSYHSSDKRDPFLCIQATGSTDPAVKFGES